MELLVAILVIFALIGLLIVGVRAVRKSGRGAGDTALVNSLNLAVSNFNREFGFLPPLVKDFESAGPLRTVSGRRVPWVYSVSNAQDAQVLRSSQSPAAPGTPQSLYDIRFSLLSLPYYVIGALEVEGVSGEGRPIDGVAGPGFLTPKRDGSFERSGRKFESFFDLSRNAKALYSSDAAAGRVVLRDANEVPVRYYRWLQGNPSTTLVASVNDCNVPLILGRASDDASLRSAVFAIVAAGPDGVFGDEADIADPSSAAPPLLASTFGMTWGELANKVGLPDPGNDPNLRQKVRDKARSDNVIAAGGGS